MVCACNHKDGSHSGAQQTGRSWSLRRRRIELQRTCSVWPGGSSSGHSTRHHRRDGMRNLRGPSTCPTVRQRSNLQLSSEDMNFAPMRSRSCLAQYGAMPDAPKWSWEKNHRAVVVAERRPRLIGYMRHGHVHTLSATDAGRRQVSKPTNLFSRYIGWPAEYLGTRQSSKWSHTVLCMAKIRRQVIMERYQSDRPQPPQAVGQPQTEASPTAPVPAPHLHPAPARRTIPTIIGAEQMELDHS